MSADEGDVRICAGCGETCDRDEGCYCPDECPVPAGIDNRRVEVTR